MSGRIPDEVLETIRARSSIVEVVSGHVALKKAGRNFVGLCPFHAEKSPSFTVNEERGLYHCFGCNEGGTVFTFLMKIDGLDFVGAVEQLAQRVGVAITRDDGAQGRKEDRNRLYQLNEAAQRRYATALKSEAGSAAREYLAARGTKPDVIDQYGLGFCPTSGSEFIAAISGRPEATQAALALGLIGRRPDGRLFDRQWGRVTFPIRDGSGRIVGFGGRALDDRQPKYLNSPESSLFHKGSTLYGLFEARSAIRSSDRVVIVEGYMDVIVLAQNGITNVVANLGTALTPEQLRLARRFGASETVAFFDGDRAGRAAALRAFEVCSAAGLLAYGAFLPDAEDPDSFVRKYGAEATVALLAAPISLLDFFLEEVDPGRDATLLQRQEAAKRVGAVLAQAADPVQFGLLARAAAERLGVDEGVFREMRRHRTAPRVVAATTAAAPAPPQPNHPTFTREEATLLEAMALDRDATDEVFRHDGVDDLLSPPAADIARALQQAWNAGGQSDTVLDRLPADLASRAAAATFGEGPLAGADHVRVVRDCIGRMQRRREENQMRELRGRLKRAEQVGDERQVQDEMREGARLLQKREQRQPVR